MSMKAKILELLREKKDRVAAGAPESEAYVSGQELCEQFGVSRTAVWKAIGQLKKEGYVIEAVQNRGYRLLDQTEEVYNQADIQSRLKTKWVAHPLQFFDSIDSTNIRAKLEAEQGAESGLLVVSDMQSAGRGRRGRGWESPAGINIYYTLMLKPDFSSDCAPMLTLVMALAVAKGIRQTLRRDSEEAAAKVGIKWPNDIVVDGKKVCGILTEMSMEQGYIQHIVIGVGINVRKQEFPEEIRDRAAAIDEQCGFRISRSQLIADIMEAFEEDYEIFLRTHDLKGLRASYAELLVNQDREVCVLDPKGEYRGIARGINDQGELLVERPDGTVEEVYAGEVSVRGSMGMCRQVQHFPGWQKAGRTAGWKDRNKRPEQIVRDRIETEQDIEVWTRTRSYSAAPTPMRRNIILTKNNLR